MKAYSLTKNSVIFAWTQTKAYDQPFPRCIKENIKIILRKKFRFNKIFHSSKHSFIFTNLITTCQHQPCGVAQIRYVQPCVSQAFLPMLLQASHSNLWNNLHFSLSSLLSLLLSFVPHLPCSFQLHFSLLL